MERLFIVQVNTLITALDYMHNIAQLVFGCFVLMMNQSLSEGVSGFEFHWDIVFEDRDNCINLRREINLSQKRQCFYYRTSGHVTL